MDLRKWKVAEGESDAARKLTLDPLDREKRLARVGAFVIAVLENDGVARLPTHVIHVPFEWLDQWSFVRDAHQNPTCCRTLSTRLGLPEIAPVGSTSGPDSRRSAQLRPLLRRRSRMSTRTWRRSRA